MIASITRDGIELEIEVDAEWQDDEPDTGINRGWIVYESATVIETKETISLTEAEQEHVAERLGDRGDDD